MSAGKHTLLGMGNPLLDISAEVGTDLLAKYDLKLNNAILAGESHLPLYTELVDKYKVSYIAGGATQNSIRVAQWMSEKPSFAAYIGSIGKDEFGKQLKAAAEADGVTTYYYETDAKPTGTCAVLINEKERSLVANLAAAELYDKAHYECKPIQDVVAGTEIFYSAGFFLTHAAAVMAETGKHAADNNKIYCLNLSAPFLCQFFKEQMHSVLPFADFVFGNESEAAAFAEANGFAGASIEEIALRISQLPKANASRSRIVVITQGADATVVAENGAARSIAVPAIAKDAIVDTNGAGDAFVGGFLAFIGLGRSVDEAVHAGHWSAGHVIQRSGCTFDATAKYPGAPKA